MTKRTKIKILILMICMLMGLTITWEVRSPSTFLPFLFMTQMMLLDANLTALKRLDKWR